MHYLIRKAFAELFPEKLLDFEAKLKYSRAFKGYNARVRYTKEYMEFRLSYNWKEVSDEIKIGLLQSLFNKVYMEGRKTVNIELYNIFLKKVPVLTPKTRSHPVLEESFSRVNRDYFGGMMMAPNLELGNRSLRTLGTYDYGTDTIRISSILLKERELLDYVMYHEMLHKKFKYKERAKNNLHHTREFREHERKFKVENIENKLNYFIRKHRFKSFF